MFIKNFISCIYGCKKNVLPLSRLIATSLPVGNKIPLLTKPKAPSPIMSRISMSSSSISIPSLKNDFFISSSSNVRLSSFLISAGRCLSKPLKKMRSSVKIN